MTSAGQEEGQATVELALLLPLLVALLLGVIQVGLVARNSVAVSHATRAAARTALVDPSAGAVRAAARQATGLDPSRLRVEVLGSPVPGAVVRVRVSYADPTDVPIIGRLVPSLTLTDELVVRVE